MAVSANYSFGMLTTETLEAGIDGVATGGDKIKYSAFDESGTLNASSTPPATKCSFDNIALVAAAKTIDLTALTGANGATVDLTGLKVQLLRITNLGANSMTFSEGASNGYELLGNGWSITVPGTAGDRKSTIQILLPDTAPDVAAGAKNIDVAGTGTQQFELSIVAG